jgi:protein-tyrosine phosphatase
MGFRWVICACAENPDYNPAPLQFLEKIELQDLSCDQLPSNSTSEFKKISAIVSKAHTKLKEGGILIHCAGGIGHTGTIIGRILTRHCGYGSAEVINFLNSVCREVGKPGWPESPWQAKVIVAWSRRKRSDRGAMAGAFRQEDVIWPFKDPKGGRNP